MEQEDIDLLKVWLCGINDKDVIKTLVLCSEYGSGKTHFIEHQLINKFNIRNITNDQLNELIEEKPKTYINFLSLIFDTVSLTNTNTKPKLLQGKVPFSCGSADCGMMHRHSRKHAAACAYPLPSGFQTRTVQCVSCRFSNTLQRPRQKHYSLVIFGFYNFCR